MLGSEVCNGVEVRDVYIYTINNCYNSHYSYSNMYAVVMVFIVWGEGQEDVQEFWHTLIKQLE